MISLNETGFLPEADKLAVSDHNGTFRIIDDNEKKQVDVNISVTEAGFDETAGSDIYRLDFSEVRDPGIYHIESADGDCSSTFKVEPHVYRSLKNALLKFFYFQRCGCALYEKHAGPFKRGVCHSKTVKVPGTDKELPIKKGWHDAGDYGRYSSAGAVAVAHMLYAFELFPEAFVEAVNIPESGNGIPDVLNECRYELDFLSEMQDEDGGVHHKVTSRVFCGFVMPEEDTFDQELFSVTSMSTADFAAVMCIASRVYEPYDPSFARDCLHQAYLAGQWLMENPENTDFRNPEGCNTGEYEDGSDVDERMWAFAELLRTDHYIGHEHDRSFAGADQQVQSRQDRYLAHLMTEMDLYIKDHPHSDGRSTDDGFGWQDVSSLGALAVVFDPDNYAGEEVRGKMLSMLCKRADAFVAMQDDGYPLSMTDKDYVWGSNMVVANRANVLIITSLALKKGEEVPEKCQRYEEAAMNQVHYILGMNAIRTSYVTGFGEHPFKNPHNRVTASDNIDRPFPGMLSGGPCKLLLDEEIKKSADETTPAQKCYKDHYMSYSTNEIAIYWNSSLLFSVAFFDR